MTSIFQKIPQTTTSCGPTTSVGRLPDDNGHYWRLWTNSNANFKWNLRSLVAFRWIRWRTWSAWIATALSLRTFQPDNALSNRRFCHLMVSWRWWPLACWVACWPNCSAETVSVKHRDSVDRLNNAQPDHLRHLQQLNEAPCSPTRWWNHLNHLTFPRKFINDKLLLANARQPNRSSHRHTRPWIIKAKWGFNSKFKQRSDENVFNSFYFWTHALWPCFIELSFTFNFKQFTKLFSRLVL